ncbi:hypothetical protein CPLU01_09769 [Colletotrichum plurivorum]|uniref:Uncharacterized protein n=1 Tax=Colletotrichum plurivorum TaxID=2175906 RepID=A0A8H6K839_9PEZI|nr:hypothetical protein CPLU01_09769 [Colletotrichum plurivorum]
MRQTTLLSITGLFQSSLAVYCEASAYLGTGQVGRCTGQHLNRGNQSQPGTSRCFPAVNGACGIIADQDGGCNCTINFFSGGDCNRTAVGRLSCHEVGAVTQVYFDHFNIRC